MSSIQKDVKIKLVLKNFNQENIWTLRQILLRIQSAFLTISLLSCLSQVLMVNYHDNQLTKMFV